MPRKALGLINVPFAHQFCKALGLYLLRVVETASRQAGKQAASQPVNQPAGYSGVLGVGGQQPSPPPLTPDAPRPPAPLSCCLGEGGGGALGWIGLGWALCLSDTQAGKDTERPRESVSCVSTDRQEHTKEEHLGKERQRDREPAQPSPSQARPSWLGSAGLGWAGLGWLAGWL